MSDWSVIVGPGEQVPPAAVYTVRVASGGAYDVAYRVAGADEAQVIRAGIRAELESLETFFSDHPAEDDSTVRLDILQAMDGLSQVSLHQVGLTVSGSTYGSPVSASVLVREGLNEIDTAAAIIDPSVVYFTA